MNINSLYTYLQYKYVQTNSYAQLISSRDLIRTILIIRTGDKKNTYSLQRKTLITIDVIKVCWIMLIGSGGCVLLINYIVCVFFHKNPIPP